MILQLNRSCYYISRWWTMSCCHLLHEPLPTLRNTFGLNSFLATSFPPRPQAREKVLGCVLRLGRANFFGYFSPNILNEIRHIFFFDTTNLYKPLPRFAVFLARPKSPDLRTETKCPKLLPEAFCEIPP